MNRCILVILALSLASFNPTAALSATKLTIGHSTINPRIAPLWIAHLLGVNGSWFDKLTTNEIPLAVRPEPSRRAPQI